MFNPAIFNSLPTAYCQLSPLLGNLRVWGFIVKVHHEKEPSAASFR